MNDLIKQVRKLSKDRTEVIENIMSAMEKATSSAQKKLLRNMLEEFLDKLDVDDKGLIRNTEANRRKMYLFEKGYNKYINTGGQDLVNTIVQSVDKIISFNNKYFSIFSSKAQLGKVMPETQSMIADWLGLTKRGGLVENGYLNRLIQNADIKNQIWSTSYQAILSNKGFFETKKELSDFIDGNQEKAGALERYHRNYVYDMFSQVDRTQSVVIAQKLKIGEFAIYEGGLVKRSRPFCKERNGHVFTRAEIEAFDPPTAKPPNYNPITDLGGYGCRHHLNWVPKTVAEALRPDLKNKKV